MQIEAKKDLAIEVANLYPAQGEWTEEDYFSLPDTNRYVELSEGRLVMPPHPTYRHQTVLQKLFIIMNTFVETNGLGVARFAPLPIRLWPGKIREPDIFFITKEHSDRIGQQFCGPPDLVVEVISSSTRKVDRLEKFYEYARAEIQEYWMVDCEENTIDIYILKEGAYTLLGKYGSGEMANSKILTGFEIPVDEVF